MANKNISGLAPSIDGDERWFVTDKLGNQLVMTPELMKEYANTADPEEISLDERVDALEAGAGTYLAAIRTVATAVSPLTLADAKSGFIIADNTLNVVAVTLPLNATVAIPIGATIKVMAFEDIATFAITVVGEDGVIVQNALTSALRAQHSIALATKIAINTWVVYGDLEPAP